MFYITNKGVPSIYAEQSNGKYRMIAFGTQVFDFDFNQNVQEEDWLVFKATKVDTIEALVAKINESYTKDVSENFIKELLSKLI